VNDAHATMYCPVHKLKDFCKIHVEPGETKATQMLLNQYAFSFYNIGVSKWVVEKGTFEIQIVASSWDIYLKEHVELQSSIEQAVTLAQALFPPILFNKQGGGNVCPVDETSFSNHFGTLSTL